MTHGRTPTERCGPSRAVRLVLEELGEDTATHEEIHRRAMLRATRPFSAEYVFRRVLVRGSLKRNGWIERVQADAWRMRPRALDALRRAKEQRKLTPDALSMEPKAIEERERRGLDGLARDAADAERGA